jgi:hypothetical protein
MRTFVDPGAISGETVTIAFYHSRYNTPRRRRIGMISVGLRPSSSANPPTYLHRDDRCPLAILMVAPGGLFGTLRERAVILLQRKLIV